MKSPFTLPRTDEQRAKESVYRNKNREYVRSIWKASYAEAVKAFKATGVMPQRLKTLVKNRCRVRLRALRKVAKTDRPECVRCGNADPRILNINHLNGGGVAELKRRKSNSIASIIMRDGRETHDLDIRCFNCNMLYEYEVRRRGDVWGEVYAENGLKLDLFEDVESKMFGGCA